MPSFATSRCPSADKTHAITAFGEHDRKEAAGLGIGQESQPDLTRRVPGVINHNAEGITEGGRRLIEGNPMLALVYGRLLWVPFEGKSHAENYAVRDLLGMRLTTCASAAGCS